MFVLSVKRRLAVCAMPVLGLLAVMGVGHAQPSGSASAAGQAAQSTTRFVDGIAAVVNKQVITLYQLEQELKAAKAQLAMQNIQAPDDETLRRQVLQRMITEELIRQEARRLNVGVNDAQLDQAVANIAQRNNMSEPQLRAEIEKSGVTWDYYRQSLRQEILTDLVRQREVDSRIMISDGEVDAFLRSQSVTGGFVGGGQPTAGAPAGQAPAQASPMQPLGLAQILIQVPESASPSQVEEYRREAQDALARIKAGADFAAVAAAVSDGPGALEGGDMGVRPAQGWPDLFLQAVQGLSANEVSDIIRSGNGFHILKVTTRGPGPQQSAQQQVPPPPEVDSRANQMAAVFQSEGPMMVTQTRARHILIKIDQATSDERARTRLEDIRQRVLAGEDFGDLARRYSEDASAPLGGDLGWLSPGETVPPFEQAMDNLQPGEISEPVKTPFGWHLITVQERRTEDMEEEFKRMRAREVLFERQVGPAFDDWLGRVRAQAYIDNRLDPRGNQLNRN